MRRYQLPCRVIPLNQLVQTAAGPTPRFGLVLLCCLMTILAMFGGSSRMDEPLLLIARIGVILIGCIAIMYHNGISLRVVRTPLLFLAAFAAIIAMQLVPLPPAIWQNRPGMEEVLAASKLAGTLDVWRPLSLDPSATFNSLMSLLPPLAVVLCYPFLAVHQRSAVPVIVLAVVAFSIAVAGFQMGGANQLYYYRIINKGVATGIMANRNHQALLLACAIPAIVAILLNRSRGSAPRFGEIILAGLGLAVVAGMVVATGSRAGLILVMISAALAGYFLWPSLQAPVGRTSKKPRSRWHNVVATSGLLFVFALLIAAMGSGGNSFSRLGEVEVGTDQRVQVIPQLIELIQKFFPFGSGFGSFPAVFQIVEPDGQLNTAYFNNAHNDFAQIIIEGSLAGAALATAGLFLGFRGLARLMHAIRTRSRATFSEDHSMLLVAVGIFVSTAFASLFDYPVRTPLMAGIIALAGCIVCDWRLNAGPVRQDIAR